MRSKTQAGIVGLGLLACAIILPVWQFRDWYLSRTSANWPSVTGTIIHSGPPLYDDGDYDPGITYEFEVSGERCIGNSVQHGIGAHLLSISDAEAWNAKYPVGARVTVYYNPNTPCISNVLERVYKPSNWFTPAIWGGMALMSAFYGLKSLADAIGLAPKPKGT